MHSCYYLRWHHQRRQGSGMKDCWRRSSLDRRCQNAVLSPGKINTSVKKLGSYFMVKGATHTALFSLSCSASKSYFLCGRDAYPTGTLSNFSSQFKCATAYCQKWRCVRSSHPPHSTRCTTNSWREPGVVSRVRQLEFDQLSIALRISWRTLQMR